MAVRAPDNEGGHQQPGGWQDIGTAKALDEQLRRMPTHLLDRDFHDRKRRRHQVRERHVVVPDQ